MCHFFATMSGLVYSWSMDLGCIDAILFCLQINAQVGVLVFTENIIQSIQLRKMSYLEQQVFLNYILKILFSRQSELTIILLALYLLMLRTFLIRANAQSILILNDDHNYGCLPCSPPQIFCHQLSFSSATLKLCTSLVSCFPRIV